jgi:hypothetical protein
VRLRAEIEGSDTPIALPNEGADLVAFMSFAAMRGFGAQHPLIALAERLHAEHRVSLGPLTTFYESEIEDSEDAEKLEMAWQPASDLEAALSAMAAALAADTQARALLARADATTLPEQVTALRDAIRDAAGRGARARLSYAL